MKAILEFNLPDDQEEFDKAVRVQKYLGLLGQLHYITINNPHGEDFESCPLTMRDLRDIVTEAEKEGLT